MSPTLPNWNYNNGWNITLGDFNGDGKTDFLVTGRSTAGTLYLSSGNGFVAQTFAVPSDWGKSLIIPGDWNGDGKTDIALIAPGGTNMYGSGHPHTVWLSTGTGFVPAKDTSNVNISIPNTDNSVTAVPADWNNDGATDFWLQKQSGDTEYLTSYTPELISSVDNGLGIVTTVTYDRLNENAPLYTKCPNQPPNTYVCGDTYPIQSVDGALYVVSRVDSGNGLGACAAEQLEPGELLFVDLRLCRREDGCVGSRVPRLRVGHDHRFANLIVQTRPTGRYSPMPARCCRKPRFVPPASAARQPSR